MSFLGKSENIPEKKNHKKFLRKKISKISQKKTFKKKCPSSSRQIPKFSNQKIFQLQKKKSHPPNFNFFRNALCLLYTPKEEHFGIVPCEAMIQGVPVIAINNGGPKETVSHGNTGYLLENDPKTWFQHMAKFSTATEKELSAFRQRCKQRMYDLFEF